MVGPDKRLNYYRLTADEVIAALHSHKMGLTHAEARRRGEVQQNILTEAPGQPRTTRYLLQTRPILLLTLLAALGLSIQEGNTALSLALTVVTIMHLILTRLTQTDRHSAELSFNALLPAHTKVVRNGQVETIGTAAVVVGDLVYLQSGDVVPADVRLIDEQNFVTNDAAILGGSTHVRKFAYALRSDVALAARNNLAFAGTTAVAGEAHGVVTATGTQTELGRIQQLTQHQQKKPGRPERLIRLQRIALFASGLTALVFLVLLSLQTEATNTMRLILLVLVALAVGILPLLVQLTTLYTKWTLRRNGIRVKDLSALDSLGRVDIMLCDPATFGGSDASAVSFAIGRSTYAITGAGYEPNGRIVDDQGKLLTKKALRELALFFESAALSHHATVLPPDGQHKSWHVHGNVIDGALLTAARRAGLKTEQLHDAHEIVSIFPFDAHRQLGGVVRRYGNDLVLFVQGTPEVLLAHSTKLWDHGHVRTLTSRDATHFTTHHTRQAASGLTCTALAYRILPRNTNVTTLTMERAEQKLTFLGAMDIGHAMHAHSRALLQAVQGSHVRVSFLTNHPSLYTIDSERLRHLSDARLLERLRKGSATFAQLTAEDKLRLVSLAQAAQHTVAICGTNLSDLPALKLAEVALDAQTSDSLWRGRLVSATVQELAQIAHTVPLSRRLANGVTHMLGVTTIDQFAALALAVLAAGVSMLLHVPAAITPLQLLVTLIVLQPLAAAITFITHPNSQAFADRHHDTLRTALTFGILAAAIALGNFLAFFMRSGISPGYLDPSSILAAHAATVTLASLVLGQWVNALLAFGDLKTLRQFYRRINTPVLAADVLAFTILLGIIYFVPIQTLLATRSLTLADWLCIVLGTALYASLHLLEYHTRQHTRHAVVQLHHEKFGKSSTARV